MSVGNRELAALLMELADLSDLVGDSPFKSRAYRNAARVVASLETEVADLVAQGEDLTRLPGIGKEIAAKLELAVRGRPIPRLEELRREVPPGLRELLTVPGLGPKRLRTLWQELGIVDAHSLAEAAQAGRLQRLPGFGPKLEAKILQALAARRDQQRRYLWVDADAWCQELVAALLELPGVLRVEAAGSYRRRRPTVGDLDILLLGDPARGAEILDTAVRLEPVREVLSHGATRASILHRAGIQVDLRLIAPESFGAAWIYFTGSKAHNIALRRRAIERGLKVNEYGVFRGDERIAGADEEEVYRVLDLTWIPPELREDRGEIEAAAEGTLPELVPYGALRGNLHTHTTASDGRADLATMVAAARRQGLEYLAITDHSAGLAVTRGLDPDRMKARVAEIRALDAELPDVHLLVGAEVEVDVEGNLDYPDEVLAQLDVVIVGVHSHFDLERERQTARIVRAIENPYTTILAHPTGRLLGSRPPYEVDLERIVTAAARRGIWLELNAQPTRLDLDDVGCRLAKEHGVGIVVNTDAHSTGDLRWLDLGLGIARRGWLTAADVVNTLPWSTFRRRLAATRPRGPRTRDR